MLVHSIFDVLALIAAALAHRWLRGRLPAGTSAQIRGSIEYRIAMIVGAGIGAFGLGSLNMWLGGVPGIGRSIEGALFGGIAGVEIYKWRSGIAVRTGDAFVLPLAVGIAVGRIGCLLAGLDDYTYGVPTGADWGWDFGDGVLRYPVQLFESVAMGAYALIYAVQVRRGKGLLLDGGFGLVVGFYGAQRFVWEFLKPYASVLGPLSLFHFVSAALIVYGLHHVLTGSHERRQPAA